MNEPQSNVFMNRLLRGDVPDEEPAPTSTPRRAQFVDGGAHEPPDARGPCSAHEEANVALRDALHEWWRGRRL
jgi:hypothetical protein